MMPTKYSIHNNLTKKKNVVFHFTKTCSEDYYGELDLKALKKLGFKK
jgi:hypothetical protein